MAASQTALAKTDQQQLVRPGPNTVAAAVERFPRDKYHVLAPIVHMDGLPMATRIAVTEIRVNSDPAAKEVYAIAGSDLMLGKVVLDRIAAAAGISWTSVRRIDDAKHPHLCQMEARGRVMDFDGTVREIVGSKLVDLRSETDAGEPGKDYSEIAEKASRAKRDPSHQLMEARKFIAEVAESKARNRAIASALGIKRSYSKEELRKPFIVPKLVLDTTHAAAQQTVLANMAGAASVLFGQPVAPPPAALGPAQVDEDDPVPTLASGGPVVDAQLDGDVDKRAQDDPIETIKAAWGKAKTAGMEAAAFRTLCKANTGKERKEDMNAAEAQAVLLAVAAFVAQGDREPGDDDVPV